MIALLVFKLYALKVPLLNSTLAPVIALLPPALDYFIFFWSAMPLMF